MLINTLSICKCREQDKVNYILSDNHKDVLYFLSPPKKKEVQQVFMQHIINTKMLVHNHQEMKPP